MMKRRASVSGVPTKANKKQRNREPEPDYCDVPRLTDNDGSSIWPAPSEAIKNARDFLIRWSVKDLTLRQC